MKSLLRGVRPLDYVLAVAMTALGIILMKENMHGQGTSKTRIDSTTWVMIPVFIAATLPILWRRVNLWAVLGVTAAALAVHDIAFHWVVRCGAGLPLAFALSYAVGRLITDRKQSYWALAATFGIQFLVLVRDSAAGLGSHAVHRCDRRSLLGRGALRAEALPAQRCHRLRSFCSQRRSAGPRGEVTEATTMERVMQRVRPVDAVMAGILCALAAVMAIEDINYKGTGFRDRFRTRGCNCPSGWRPRCRCSGGGAISSGHCWRRPAWRLCTFSHSVIRLVADPAYRSPSCSPSCAGFLTAACGNGLRRSGFASCS